MTIPNRILVQIHFAIPVSEVFKIQDKNISEFLRIFHEIFDEMVTNFSSKINFHMTDRLGDTFYGPMIFGSGSSMQIPVFSVDPAVLVNSMIWYNSTSGTFKCYQNGAIKTFTVV